MILVDKIELFHWSDLNRPDSVITPETGKIDVEWVMHNNAHCALMTPGRNNYSGCYLSGNYYGRMKIYFRNGYVWDTRLKTGNEWRKMIYDSLKQYIESGYEALPGEDQSAMSRAARLLDDEMQYEI